MRLRIIYVKCKTHIVQWNGTFSLSMHSLNSNWTAKAKFRDRKKLIWQITENWVSIPVSQSILGYSELFYIVVPFIEKKSPINSEKITDLKGFIGNVALSCYLREVMK